MSVELTEVTIKSDMVTDRTHAKIMREAMHKVAMTHKRVTLGKHFKKLPETEPGGAYGYVKRGALYTRRKLAKYGHNIPNMRTGYLRNRVYSQSVVTATQHRSRVYIRAPFPLTEQRRRELEAITPVEVAEAQILATETYQALAANPKNQRKRRKRVK